MDNEEQNPKPGCLGSLGPGKGAFARHLMFGDYSTGKTRG